MFGTIHRRHLLGLAASLPLIAAVRPGFASQPVLRIGNGPAVDGFDPHKTSGIPTNNILLSHFEALTYFDGAGRAAPGAALSWTVSADGRTWTFRLNPAGRWSDGTPVTAHDFVAGWQRLVTPATAASYINMIVSVAQAKECLAGKAAPNTLGVTAADDLTLVVRLEYPEPDLPRLLAHMSMVPLHRPSMAKDALKALRPGTMVGNGAYVIAGYAPQDHVRLVPNPHHRKAGSVAWGEVRFIVTEDPQSEFSRFRAGELDLTYTLPSNQFGWAKTNLPAALRSDTSGACSLLAPNFRKGPLAADPALREALSIAIDRDALAGKVLGAGETAMVGLVPPGLGSYRAARPDWADMPPAARLDLARQRLAASGYRPGRDAPLTLLYATNDTVKRAVVAVAAMWKQRLGVEIVLENLEMRVLQARMRTGEGADLNFQRPIGRTAAQFLEIYTSASLAIGTGYANPAFDAALERARREAELERRANLLRDAEMIALKDGAVIPLYAYPVNRMVSPTIDGLSSVGEFITPVADLRPKV